MALSPLGNFNHVVVSASIDFASNSKGDTPLHSIVYDYSCADWDGLCDNLRDVPGGDMFKLSASAEAIEICEWVQVRMRVYIPQRKYQIKPYSFPWF